MPNLGSILTIILTTIVAIQHTITHQKKLIYPCGPTPPKRLICDSCSWIQPAAIPGNIIPNAMKAVQKA